MYLKLSEKSFLKKRPDAFLFFPYKNGFRNSVKINETAFDILSLCNGNHTFDNIVKHLKNKYKENEQVIKKYINDFLTPFISSGIIEIFNHCQNSKTEIIKGNRNFFYPDIIIWEITDFCPLNCKHCYLTKKNNNVFSKNDIKKVLKIIDESGVYQVQLTGGEALSHPNFDYIVDELIKRGIIINISTSGFIFNNMILNTLKKLKSISGSFVRVSLDGSKTTHNYIRQNEGAYKKVLNFIKTLKNHKIPYQISTVIVNQTKDELEQLTLLAKKNEAYLIEFGILTVQGNAKKNNLRSFFEKKELIEFLKILSNKFSDDNFTVKVPIEKEIIKNCGAGYQLIVIRANKNISICPTAEFNIGNIDNCSIEKIMLTCGKQFCDISAPNKILCKDCKNQMDCFGCIARALVLKNTVKKCEWFESQYKYLKTFLDT